MPEFAGPILSSWLLKRFQYYLFFYSFVPIVLLRLHRAVFGRVRSILLTYSPWLKALRPFPSQILIHRTAISNVVPTRLLKSVQEKLGLALRVMAIYHPSLLSLCTEVHLPDEDQICRKGRRKLCCPRTLQLRNCESAFLNNSEVSLFPNGRRLARNG